MLPVKDPKWYAVQVSDTTMLMEVQMFVPEKKRDGTRKQHRGVKTLLHQNY